MNLWKRAYLHTVRKKGKTILMFCILLIVSTLILTCLSIQSATNTAALNIRKSLMGSFTINAKHFDTQLEDYIVSEIINTDGITSNYNLRSYYHAEYRGMDGQALKTISDGAAEVPEGYEHAGKIVSNTHSDADTYFTEAGFELIEGRHIVADDGNVIIISEALASQNGLSISDYLVLGTIEETDSQVEARIVGIFTATMPLDAGIAPSYDLYENVSFSDNETYSQLYYNDGNTHYQYGDFNVDDPAELDTIISNVKTISGITWDDCIITKNDVDYQNAKTVLGTLQSLVTIIILVVIVISVVLLALVLSLWVRNRIHETGILLAMGFRKVNILTQHIVEILMIAVLTFALSFVTSSLMAQSVGDRLLQQATAEDQVVATNLAGETAEEKTVEKPVSRTSIEIKVSLLNLLLVYVIGTAIILLSVSISAYPIMRMKPKEILTKMS